MSGHEVSQTLTGNQRKPSRIAVAPGSLPCEHRVRNSYGHRWVRMSERTSIVLSQAVTSLTNALFGFEIARRSSSKELGGLGIAIALSLVVIGACRACCAELLLQRPLDGDEPMARRVAWQIGVIGMAILGVSALVLGPEVRAGVGFMALAMPFIVMEDFERFVSFRAGAWRAVVGDASWLVSMVLVFGLLYRTGSRSTSAVVFAYVIGGFAGWLAMSIGRRRTVMHFGGRGWWSAHPVRARTYGTEFLLSTLLSGLSLPLLGATAGLAAAGDVRAYLTILGPTIFVVQACGLLSARRIGFLSIRDCVGDGRLWALSCLSALSGVVMGFVLLIVPQRRGVELLGSSWAPLASNGRHIIALSFLAPFAIAPIQVARLYWPRRALIARFFAAFSLTVVVAIRPVRQSLPNYLLASAIAQFVVGVFTVYTFLHIRNSSSARLESFG
jgi:hypothetical protein